jgi:hypothetical protein
VPAGRRQSDTPNQSCGNSAERVRGGGGAGARPLRSPSPRPRRPRAALSLCTRPARARHYRALLQRQPCWSCAVTPKRPSVEHDRARSAAYRHAPRAVVAPRPFVVPRTYLKVHLLAAHSAEPSRVVVQAKPLMAATLEARSLAAARPCARWCSPRSAVPAESEVPTAGMSVGSLFATKSASRSFPVV